METYEIVLRIIMILVFGYTLLKFGQRYFVQLTNFMFNTPTTWNKHIDKPRFYLYAFGLLFMIIAFRMFQSTEPIFSIPLEVPKTLFFLVFLLGGLICHFTWTQKFRAAFIPDIQKKLNPISKLNPTINNQSRINEIFTELESQEYLKGKLVIFKSLVQLENISESDKMNWIHKSPTNKKEINRQTLFELLSNLLIGFESLETREIRALCNRYFHNDGLEIKISSKNVSQWKSNKALYLKEVSNIIKG